MNKAERIRNEKLGAGLIKALALRHFDAYYCASCAEAAEKILSLIPQTDVVSWGGSVTMEALGVIDRVKKGGWRVIDRGTASGVHENMPVVTEKGLVGVVIEAAPYSSKVRLILDPRAAVGTIVQRQESRVAGIVEGGGPRGGRRRGTAHEGQCEHWYIEHVP